MAKKEYKNQWIVESSDGRRDYVISENFDGSFECGCRGWTGHYPRTDCTHIRQVQSGGGKTFADHAIDRLR